MRQGQSFLVIVLGLLILWLAVSGRLEAVWSALIGAASGEAPGSPGTVGGVGGGGGTTGSGPVLGVTLPDYMEFLTPSFDRYRSIGAGKYETIPGDGWTRNVRPVAP